MVFASLEGANVVHAPCNRSRAMAQGACSEMTPGGFVSQYNNSIGTVKAQEGPAVVR